MARAYLVENGGLGSVWQGGGVAPCGKGGVSYLVSTEGSFTSWHDGGFPPRGNGVSPAPCDRGRLPRLMVRGEVPPM